jgi:hypothetical protein
MWEDVKLLYEVRNARKYRKQKICYTENKLINFISSQEFLKLFFRQYIKQKIKYCVIATYR